MVVDRHIRSRTVVCCERLVCLVDGLVSCDRAWELAPLPLGATAFDKIGPVLTLNRQPEWEASVAQTRARAYQGNFDLSICRDNKCAVASFGSARGLVLTLGPPPCCSSRMADPDTFPRTFEGRRNWSHPIPSAPIKLDLPPAVFKCHKPVDRKAGRGDGLPL